jgi:hypothetical protein
MLPISHIASIKVYFVFIVLSCSKSLYKLAMMSFSTASCISLHTSHPNPLADLIISHINASSLYAFNTHLKLNRTQLDEIESALFLQYRYDIICISEHVLDQMYRVKISKSTTMPFSTKIGGIIRVT